MSNLIAKYDTEETKLTPRFVEALKELMWAEMEMMRAHDADDADCWTWGICEVLDLAHSRGLQFTFGGEGDQPAGFPYGTDVWVKEAEQEAT